MGKCPKNFGNSVFKLSLRPNKHDIKLQVDPKGRGAVAKLNVSLFILKTKTENFVLIENKSLF